MVGRVDPAEWVLGAEVRRGRYMCTWMDVHGCNVRGRTGLGRARWGRVAASERGMGGEGRGEAVWVSERSGKGVRVGRREEGREGSSGGEGGERVCMCMCVCLQVCV